MDAPRDDLTRSVPFVLERSDDEPDGLTFTGYAAVFDERTTIDSWEGRFTEEIRRGAFAKTLRERKPVFQFDHGHHPSIGSLPIGVITDAREDDHGVFVKARMHTSPIFEPIRESLMTGAIDGMSFRFSVVRDEWDESAEIPHRTITELKAPEMGPVVFPAYQATSAALRSLTVDAALADPALRADLARALILGTSSDDAARVGTSSQDAADPATTPPLGAPGGMSHHARERELALYHEGAPS